MTVARWAPRRSDAHQGLYERILTERADHHADVAARIDGSTKPFPIWPTGEPLKVRVWELPPELRHRFRVESSVIVHADDRVEVVSVEPAGDVAPVVELAPRRGMRY
jgi:hypothetical protein